jgi:amylosucrase
MVQIWSAFASQDARIMAAALSRFPSVPTTAAWGTYVRCHDDIGWAIDDADAASVGWNGAAHRKFLSDFYIGNFPGSFSKGAAFQENEVTGDRRISGSLASLLGIERAIADKDELALEIAVQRIYCSYAMVYGYGGIPLLYMGDELGLTNDYSYVEVPEHADDNRWLHRPMMPWNIAATRHDPATVAGKVFNALTHLGQARSTLPSLHASVATQVEVPGHQSVVMFTRKHAAGTFIGVFNLSPISQMFSVDHLYQRGITKPFDVLRETSVKSIAGQIALTPYAAHWIINQ